MQGSPTEGFAKTQREGVPLVPLGFAHAKMPLNGETHASGSFVTQGAP